jgi:acetyltransferase-like isoleucine patch superfamily enzyme
LTIGMFCSIAEWVKIFLWGNKKRDVPILHPIWFLDDRVKEKNYGNGNVSIWNDVRIWQDVKIMSWVHIGNGAIIWTGSIVTKNVLPYSIVWWSPASHIKFRFAPHIIKEIEELARRDLPLNKIVSIKLSGKL